ncbi:hypothetical protein M409DRAFT_57349 [Zasmidium cellare ATCC 36951]|uniref:Mmc1 C-terminal domain-containing protein n=1 Tax=Zasmidium cellare ATCC 36951 TaxID=1080233 RepID=A0A6A6C8S3_ZASCE|nr:uncharacterized protein M409DRAFT_57349 [Zasmidium cellare ATCC 36951]KAF2163441.1 hypothetical protein M409DRAFT_57349 [Zasmidium cellare ATCC 36951]
MRQKELGLKECIWDASAAKPVQATEAITGSGVSVMSGQDGSSGLTFLTRPHHSMPPRIPLTTRSVRIIHKDSYVCPSCLLKDAGRAEQPTPIRRFTSERRVRDRTRPDRNEGPKARVTHRYASNGALASSTAVNAPSTVPFELRDLHQHLQLLQDKASVYVDLSRLQLALRSLESEDPIIRIAFLGLGSNGVQSARRLARLLLSDELGEEAAWEQELLDPRDGRSVLLRYGGESEESGVQPANSPLVKEMRIPSARLKGWNVEILITGFNASGYNTSDSAESTTELEESILVPPITMPNSNGGRVGFVRYPVHKALIVSEGVTGAVELGKLPAALADDRLISAALNLPLRGKASEDGTSLKAISIDIVEPALQALRKDYRANGAIYSSQWQQSNVASVASWLSKASRPSSEGHSLKPAVEALLNSELARSTNLVSTTEAKARSSSDAVPESKRTTLQSAISSWSEEAHRDLQLNLNNALTSPAWRRTSWWRLFWRIDEVSMSASDVLRRGWLVDAEQSLAFISGRILEAGLASEEDLKKDSVSNIEDAKLLPGVSREEFDEYKAANAPSAAPQKIESLANLTEFPVKVARMKEESGLDVFFDPPWPQTIHLAREQMLHQLVPSMHLKAQALLLTSLSTIGGSAALAGWLWVASGGVAFYEAGAIAALGLVWALRRLQTKWSLERQKFSETAREDARGVLAEVEGKLRRLVTEGGRVAIRTEDEKEWIEARQAIGACQEALKEAASHGSDGK